MIRSRLASGSHIKIGRLARTFDVLEVLFPGDNCSWLDTSEAFRLCPFPGFWASFNDSPLSTTDDLSNLKSVFFL